MASTRYVIVAGTFDSILECKQITYSIFNPSFRHVKRTEAAGYHVGLPVSQTLKILRYGTKLLLACGAISNVDSQSYKNLSSIESSIGVSRKTYRMGKFLQNVTALRKIPLRAPHALLEVTVNIGECIYYFTDQFQW